MNPELDPAGDGDGDGDDENARRKIKIEYIEDKSRRHITFSKRKAGIMKKVRKFLLSYETKRSDNSHGTGI
jgi:MADS-box transcription factor